MLNKCNYIDKYRVDPRVLENWRVVVFAANVQLIGGTRHAPAYEVLGVAGAPGILPCADSILRMRRYRQTPWYQLQEISSALLQGSHTTWHSGHSAPTVPRGRPGRLLGEVHRCPVGGSNGGG
jgi:hypothetical protein